MKNLLFLLLSICWLTACEEMEGSKKDVVAKENTAEAALTTMQWIDQEKDLGKVNEGQVLEIDYRFKNTGNKPLVIKNVRPGCGCTLVETPKEPIAPGEEGVIKGSFNSQGRPGLNHKEIYVEANTENSPNHTLKFQVDVVKKPS